MRYMCLVCVLVSPYCLCNLLVVWLTDIGDVITMGGSELEVFIQCNRDDKENLDDACFASV